MNILGIPVRVFSLKTIDTYMDGYYMDADGGVWSTRGRVPARLTGSSTPSGRYYTLNKRSHRADQLVYLARAHKTFASETAKTIELAVAKATPPAPLQGRTQSARTAAGARGFLLATLTPTDKLAFGTNPVFHLTEATVRAEAERIAAESGIEVVLLRIVGKVKVQKAVWE